MRVTSFEGRFDDLGPFVELLRSTGLLDLMLCLGWSCVIPVSAWHDGRFRQMQLAKYSGQFAIEGTDANRLSSTNQLLANLFTACSCARLDPCCTVSWFTHSFLLPRTPLNREGALCCDFARAEFCQNMGYFHTSLAMVIHLIPSFS